MLFHEYSKVCKSFKLEEALRLLLLHGLIASVLGAVSVAVRALVICMCKGLCAGNSILDPFIMNAFHNPPQRHTHTRRRLLCPALPGHE